MFLLDEEKMYYSVFFEKVCVKGFNEVFFLPKRAMFGMVDEDMNVFTEFSSGVKHLHLMDILNTDIDYGFELCVSVKEVLDNSIGSDIALSFHELWNYFQEQVYFYSVLDDESFGFVSKSKEEFYQEFGVDFRCLSTVDANKILEDYVSGKLTTCEYYNKVYRKDNNVIKLVPKN